MTVDFRAAGRATEVIITHEQLAEQERDAHTRGWTSALDKLDGFSAPHSTGVIVMPQHQNHCLQVGAGFAQGLVRDLRVRWALEEAGLPYEEKLLAAGEQNSPAHRALQPFGQVPVYEEDGLTLFESAAIVMHIGERCATLMPTDPVRRARTRTWMFAAMNSVEPHVQNLASIDIFHANEEWARLRRPGAEKMAQSRLDGLASVARHS